MATMKSKVIQFVKDNGPQRFTDIQKFIVETKFGPGTYGRDYRGYYCSAFSGSRHSRKRGYFLEGNPRLVKLESGKYDVIHNTENPFFDSNESKKDTQSENKTRDLDRINSIARGTWIREMEKEARKALDKSLDFENKILNVWNNFLDDYFRDDIKIERDPFDCNKWNVFIEMNNKSIQYYVLSLTVMFNHKKTALDIVVKYTNNESFYSTELMSVMGYFLTTLDERKTDLIRKINL